MRNRITYGMADGSTGSVPGSSIESESGKRTGEVSESILIM